MAQRSGSWIGVALVLAALGATYLTFDIVQGHRYAKMEKRMEEALRDFAKRARLRISKDSYLDLAGDGEVPTVACRVENGLGTWLWFGPDGNPSVRSHGIHAWLYRYSFQWRPVVEVSWVDMHHSTLPVEALFRQVMREHDVEYRFFPPRVLANSVPPPK